MAETNKRQIADALAAMGDGNVADPYAEPPPPGTGRFAPPEAERAIAPPPDPSVFAAKRATRELVAERQLHTKRTFIPILLTSGVLLPVMGSLKWLMGPDSPFAAWSVWVPVALSACGLVLLMLARANMVQVRQLMRTSSGKGAGTNAVPRTDTRPAAQGR